MLYNMFSLVIYFMHSINSVYVSTPISQFLPVFPPSCPYICPLQLCLCFCFTNKIIYTIFLEKAMAPHSRTLAWKIPWMEEPGGLQSMGS